MTDLIVSNLVNLSTIPLCKKLYRIQSRSKPNLNSFLVSSGQQKGSEVNEMKTYRTTINLLLDLALAIAFLVSFQPVLTGLAIHEWLGLALGGALLLHLLLHWRWAIGVARKWLCKLPFKTRIYTIVDASLLVAFLTIIGSGVAMSRAVLSLFGLTGSTGSAWFVIHKWSSMLTLGLIGIKLVLHRTWFAALVKKLGRQRDRVHRGALLLRPSAERPCESGADRLDQWLVLLVNSGG